MLLKVASDGETIASLFWVSLGGLKTGRMAHWPSLSFGNKFAKRR